MNVNNSKLLLFIPAILEHVSRNRTCSIGKLRTHNKNMWSPNRRRPRVCHPNSTLLTRMTERFDDICLKNLKDVGLCQKPLISTAIISRPVISLHYHASICYCYLNIKLVVFTDSSRTRKSIVFTFTTIWYGIEINYFHASLNKLTTSETRNIVPSQYNYVLRKTTFFSGFHGGVS